MIAFYQHIKVLFSDCVKKMYAAIKNRKCNCEAYLVYELNVPFPLGATQYYRQI